MVKNKSMLEQMYPTSPQHLVDALAGHPRLLIAHDHILTALKIILGPDILRLGLAVDAKVPRQAVAYATKLLPS